MSVERFDSDKAFIAEFIKLYKSLTSLWKIRSKEYTDRVQKEKDYNILIKKMQEIDPNATKQTVIKKIGCLRGCYRRELKKKRNSIKTASGPDDIYIPTLWYYDLLHFLEDQEDWLKNINTITDENTSEELPPRPVKRKCTDEEKLIKLAYEKLSRKNEPTVEDTLAQSWAWQYSEMETSQKIIVRKIFADVLFQGALGNLKVEHTYQIQNLFRENENTSPKSITPSSTTYRHFQEVPNNFCSNENQHEFPRPDSPSFIKEEAPLSSSSSAHSSRGPFPQIHENSVDLDVKPLVVDEKYESDGTIKNFYTGFEDTE